MSQLSLLVVDDDKDVCEYLEDFLTHDGYRVVYSLPELDPVFTEARALLADRVDGKPLAGREGPLRIVLPSEKREARWIRMVEKIEILSAPESPR